MKSTNKERAIVWPEPASLSGRTDKEFLQSLRQRLRGRVQAAYIFGSFGTPDFHHHSDIDLILVKASHTPFWDRAREFSDLYDLYPRLDILVYTRSELDSLLSESTGFWKSVKQRLRQILPE